MTYKKGIKIQIFIPVESTESTTSNGFTQKLGQFSNVKHCPSCGSALVLVHDKFGEFSKRLSSESAVSDSTTKTEAKSDSESPKEFKFKEILRVKEDVKIQGGWTCTNCPVHIMPDQTTISTRTKAVRLSASRSMEDLKDPLKYEDNTKLSPSSNNEQLLDENFDDIEQQFQQSFVTLLSHMREHFTLKESQLKEFQLDLCQRERIITSNEGQLEQRITNLRQSESILKEKTDRLNLYKDTMLAQVEARAQQLNHYEHTLRDWRSRIAKENTQESIQPQEHRGQPPGNTASWNSSRPRSRSDFLNEYRNNLHGNTTKPNPQIKGTNLKIDTENLSKTKEQTIQYQVADIPKQSWSASQLLTNGPSGNQPNLLKTTMDKYSGRKNSDSKGEFKNNHIVNRGSYETTHTINPSNVQTNYNRLKREKSPVHNPSTAGKGRFASIYSKHSTSREHLNKHHSDSSVSRQASLVGKSGVEDTDHNRPLVNGDSGYASVNHSLSPGSRLNQPAPLPHPKTNYYSGLSHHINTNEKQSISHPQSKEQTHTRQYSQISSEMSSPSNRTLSPSESPHSPKLSSPASPTFSEDVFNSYSYQSAMDKAVKPMRADGYRPHTIIKGSRLVTEI